MKNWFFPLVVFFLLPLIVSAEASLPFQQTNRFAPLFMTLTPAPDSPDLPEKKASVSVAIDYSSIFIDEETDDWEAVVDLEYTTFTFMAEASVGDFFSLGVEAPFVAMGSGFLDGFLNEYHSIGGFPDYGRSERPNNEFMYYIREKYGPYWYQAKKSGFVAADSTLSLKVPLSSLSRTVFSAGYRFNAAFKYSLKIPTGDKSQGLGSGGYDHGIFLLTKLKKENLVFFISPGVILPSDPETNGANIHLKNMGTLFLGLGYTYRKDWFFSAQLNGFSSPYDFDINAFDLPGIELTMGVRYQLTPTASVEATFSEDVVGIVPDFTIHTGLRLSI